MDYGFSLATNSPRYGGSATIAIVPHRRRSRVSCVSEVPRDSGPPPGVDDSGPSPSRRPSSTTRRNGPNRGAETSGPSTSRTRDASTRATERPTATASCCNAATRTVRRPTANGCRSRASQGGTRVSRASRPSLESGSSSRESAARGVQNSQERGASLERCHSRERDERARLSSLRSRRRAVPFFATEVIARRSNVEVRANHHVCHPGTRGATILRVR